MTRDKYCLCIRQIMESQTTTNKTTYYVPYFFNEEGNDKLFGIYSTEQKAIQSIVEWFYSNEFYYAHSYFPIEYHEEAKLLTTQSEMYEFLKKYSKDWRSFGGSPGWMLTVQKCQID